MTDWSVIVESRNRGNFILCEIRQKSTIEIIAAMACGMLALLGGCKQEVAKAPPPKPPVVFVASPASETLTDFEEYSGRLAAVEVVDIRARVSGYLDDVLFKKDGMDVEQGTPLFQIDRRPFELTLANAEAMVLQLEARLEGLRRQEARTGQLAGQKVATEAEVDTILFQRKEADAQLKAAREMVAMARLNLDFTHIKSPLNGRISRRLVDPGNLVKADDTLLANIVSLDPLHAYFDVDERTVLQIRRLIASGRMKSAMEAAIPVELALADESEYHIPGELNFVDNQISSSTGTLRMRANVSNPQKLLAPGMFVRVKVPIGTPQPMLLIREEALCSDQGQRFVWVVNDENEVVYRRVKEGKLIHGRRVILKGLEAGERIIVSGLQRVRPGIKVDAKPLEGKDEKPAQATASSEAKPNRILIQAPQAN